LRHLPRAVLLELGAVLEYHVLLAMHNDDELDKLLAGVTITHGAVLPNISDVPSVVVCGLICNRIQSEQIRNRILYYLSGPWYVHTV
jgi:hypothetical protein